jgi:hypothetical protein
MEAEGSMSETVNRRRRRWPWVILTVILLLVGGSVAWNLRPLNANERAMVGLWKNGPSYRVFTANRRYVVYEPAPGGSVRKIASGSWYVENDRLGCCMDMRTAGRWSDIRWSLLLLIKPVKRTEIGKLRIDGRDNFVLEMDDMRPPSRAPFARVTQLPPLLGASDDR